MLYLIKKMDIRPAENPVDENYKEIQKLKQ